MQIEQGHITQKKKTCANCWTNFIPQWKEYSTINHLSMCAGITIFLKSEKTSTCCWENQSLYFKQMVKLCLSRHRRFALCNTPLLPLSPHFFLFGVTCRCDWRIHTALHLLCVNLVFGALSPSNVEVLDKLILHDTVESRWYEFKGSA